MPNEIGFVDNSGGTLAHYKMLEKIKDFASANGWQVLRYDAVSINRELILKGVDGVCFVADSQEERFDANIESLENLRLNLSEQGYDLDKLPYVIQYNKRDLPNAMTVAELAKDLNTTQVPEFEGVATTGPDGKRLKGPAKSLARKQALTARAKQVMDEWAGGVEAKAAE